MNKRHGDLKETFYMLAHHLWDSLRQSKAPAISFIHFMQSMELSDAKTVFPVSLKVILRMGGLHCDSSYRHPWFLLLLLFFKTNICQHTLMVTCLDKILRSNYFELNWLKINFNAPNCYVHLHPSSQLPVYTPWNEDRFGSGLRDYQKDFIVSEAFWPNSLLL